MLASILMSFLSIVPAQPIAGDGWVVVGEFPHDPRAFTQGFSWEGGRLFESTGLEGQSELRRVDLETGRIRRAVALDDEYFGEGSTIIGDRIFYITWQERTAFVFDRGSFELLRTHSYKGEGWGLTDHKGKLIMSNGTATIRWRRPGNFRAIRRIKVVDEGEPVTGLNELEWVRGQIWANVWPTNRIARIDPATGAVEGWLDLGPLRDRENTRGDADVTNGIAYLRSEKRLFVTGKWWDSVYEIKLTS